MHDGARAAGKAPCAHVLRTICCNLRYQEAHRDAGAAGSRSARAKAENLRWGLWLRNKTFPWARPEPLGTGSCSPMETHPSRRGPAAATARCPLPPPWQAWGPLPHTGTSHASLLGPEGGQPPPPSLALATRSLHPVLPQQLLKDSQLIE